MQVLSGCGHAVHEDVPDKVLHTKKTLQWNLRIKDTLGQGVLSFIERFPLFGG